MERVQLTELGRLTDQMRHPQDACSTWWALYLGLHKLKQELMEHIHLENNLLFARQKALLIPKTEPHLF